MVNAHAAFSEFMKDKQSIVHQYKEAVRSALVNDAANDAVGTEQSPGALVISRSYKASHLKVGQSGVQYVSGRPEYTVHSRSHDTLVRSELDTRLRTGSMDDFLTQYVVRAPVTTSATGVAHARAGSVSAFFPVRVDDQPKNVRFASVGTHYHREMTFQSGKHSLTFANGTSSCANVMFLRMAPEEADADADVWEALVVFGGWSRCFSKMVLPPRALVAPEVGDAIANMPEFIGRGGAATRRYLSEKFPVVRYFLSDAGARNDESIPFMKGLLHTMVRLRWAYTVVVSIGAAMLFEKKQRGLLARKVDAAEYEAEGRVASGRSKKRVGEREAGQTLTSICKTHVRAFDQAVRAVVSADAREWKAAKELGTKLKDARAAGDPETEAVRALNGRLKKMMEDLDTKRAIDWKRAPRTLPGIEDCAEPSKMPRFLVAAAECVTALYEELLENQPDARAQEQLNTLRVGHCGKHGYGHHCLVRILEETPVFMQAEPKQLVLKKRAVFPVMVVVRKADPFKLAACFADTWVVKLHYCAYSQRYLNMAQWVSVDGKQRPAWAKSYQASLFATGYNPTWHAAHADHTAVIPVEMSLLQKAEFYVETPARKVENARKAVH